MDYGEINWKRFWGLRSPSSWHWISRSPNPPFFAPLARSVRLMRLSKGFSSFQGDKYCCWLAAITCCCCCCCDHSMRWELNALIWIQDMRLFNLRYWDVCRHIRIRPILMWRPRPTFKRMVLFDNGYDMRHCRRATQYQGLLLNSRYGYWDACHGLSLNQQQAATTTAPSYIRKSLTNIYNAVTPSSLMWWASPPPSFTERELFFLSFLLFGKIILIRVYIINDDRAGIAGGFGVFAGTAALFFLGEIPRFRIDILERIPIIGPYYHREIPPEDNVSITFFFFFCFSLFSSFWDRMLTPFFFLSLSLLAILKESKRCTYEAIGVDWIGVVKNGNELVWHLTLAYSRVIKKKKRKKKKRSNSWGLWREREREGLS